MLRIHAQCQHVKEAEHSLHKIVWGLGSKLCAATYVCADIYPKCVSRCMCMCVCVCLCTFVHMCEGYKQSQLSLLRMPPSLLFKMVSFIDLKIIK